MIGAQLIVSAACVLAGGFGRMFACESCADERVLMGRRDRPPSSPLICISIIDCWFRSCCTLTLVGSSSVRACAGNVLLGETRLQMVVLVWGLLYQRSHVHVGRIQSDPYVRVAWCDRTVV